MEAVFFTTPLAFRKWLQKHHKSAKELTVGFYKVSSGKPTMTWPESVEQALCFGWIDGIRKSIDEVSYCIRFTPRKTNSTWSLINIRKVEELRKSGLMLPAGQQAFDSRKQSRAGLYSHENEPAKLADSYLKLFKSNKAAWKFFSEQPPSYKKVMTHWIMSAKQEKTRRSRLERTITHSGQQKRML